MSAGVRAAAVDALGRAPPDRAGTMTCASSLAEEAVFAGVRIQAADGDARLREAEQLAWPRRRSSMVRRMRSVVELAGAAAAARAW